MKPSTPPPREPPLPPRPMDRQRIGKNDPPLSATPKERARPLSCLEEFEISYCTRTNNFVAFYKEPNRAFICYLGTDNPPEETI